MGGAAAKRHDSIRWRRFLPRLFLYSFAPQVPAASPRSASQSSDQNARQDEQSECLPVTDAGQVEQRRHQPVPQDHDHQTEEGEQGQSPRAEHQPALNLALAIMRANHVHGNTGDRTGPSRTPGASAIGVGPDYRRNRSDHPFLSRSALSISAFPRAVAIVA